MKPTLTINLNSTVFHVDNDAYEALSLYLNEIEHHFQDNERKEIMADIEARIAELFSEKLSNIKNVISIDDVNEIMSVLGSPEQFSAEDEEKSTPKPETTKQERRQNRKYFRNPDNALLGGVLSGLAAYLGWETTVVRLFFVIITLLGYGWPIAAYFIVWIIAPKASTTAQKLEMQGEEPTIENIKSYLESEQFKSSITEVGSTFMRCFQIAIKVIGILIGIVLFTICTITVICALIVAITGLFLIITNDPILNEPPVSQLDIFFENPIVACITGISIILLLFIPLISIIIGSINLIRRNNKLASIKLPTFLKVTSITLWVISSIIFISMVFLAAIDETELNNSIHRHSSTISSTHHTSKTFNVEDFDAVELSAAVNLIIKNGDSSTITIAGYDNALDNFKCESTDGTLHLYRKGNTNGNAQVDVTIYKTDLSLIDASAACRVTSSDTIFSKCIDIYASAASKVNLNVIADTIRTVASAASKITVNGKCQYIDAKASAASKSDFRHLDSENKKINYDFSSSVKK